MVISEKGSSVGSPPIAVDINAASRTLHTQLNRLITSRLPLALPPFSSDPTAYSTGLLHFAHVYLTFESLFHDLAAQSSVINPALSILLEDPWVHVAQSTPTAPSAPDSEHDSQLQKFLAQLLPPGLPRSKRLIADLAFLFGQRPSDFSASLARFPGKKVQEFATHIREEASKKPHVLIAYAWCFYMAVFSGGRWIRSQLMTADSKSFWGADKPLSQTGLSFFHFDGEDDGESIKAEFKQRLYGAEEILSPKEREEVAEEAKNIFIYCESLVSELDEMLSTPATVQNNEGSTLPKEILEIPAPVTASGKTVRFSADATPAQKHRRVDWTAQSSLAALAIALSCVSWYAMCKFGTPTLLG